MRRDIAVALLSAFAAVCGTLAAAGWFPGGRSSADAQEPKRFFYKIVDVQADTAAMQTTLNEYGAAGWELVVVGMGDMTMPRLIFKK
jgi:hypothetical protein